MTASSTLSNGSLALEPSQLKRWTVQDYHRMGELGLFDTDEHTELLAGQITLMAPKGTPHVTALHLLAHALRVRLGERALVRTQSPIQLDNFSEPEPDLAVVQGTILDYAEQHPTRSRFTSWWRSLIQLCGRIVRSKPSSMPRRVLPIIGC